MTQNERYQARRARGQCALCPNQIDDEVSGRQPWCCFSCRVKLAEWARNRRLKRSMIAVFKGGRMVQIGDMEPSAAALFCRSQPEPYKCLIHFVQPEERHTVTVISGPAR